MADLYCHPTLGPYKTLAEAYAVAVDGDRILLSPGNWLNVELKKAVHLIGATDNPIASPVILSGQGGYGDVRNRALAYTLAAAPPFPIYVQNLTLAQTQYWSQSAVFSCPAGGRLILNRCELHPNGSQYGITNSNGCTIRLVNVTFTSGGYAPILYAHPTQVWEFVRCHFVGGIWYYMGTGPLNIPISDYVTANADGYGWGYGSLIDVNYTWLKVHGSVVLPQGVDRSTAKVYLLQESPAGDIRLESYTSATPNAATGAWEFKWVPPGIRFWVMVLPPAGYEPRIEGPLTGVAV